MRLCSSALGRRRGRALYHLAGLRAQLRTWSERVRGGATEEEFVSAATADLEAASDEETAASYPAGCAALAVLRGPAQILGKAGHLVAPDKGSGAGGPLAVGFC